MNKADLRSESIRAFISSRPPGKLDEPATRELLAKVAEGGLAADEQRDLQALLQHDQFVPVAIARVRQVLESPPAPPRTVAPPAAIGSTQQSTQTTGPTAARLDFPARGLIQTWAIPGSTVRVYNASSLEDGKPRLIKTLTVPLDAPADGRPHCVQGAYPTQRAFDAEAESFRAAPHDGLVLASIPLEPEDDQDAFDTFLVTQQTASRGESDPVSLKLHAYSAFSRVDRPLNIDTANLRYENGALSAAKDYAVPAGTVIEARRNNKPVGLHAVADARGRFALDLSTLGALDGVTLHARSPSGRNEQTLELSAFGVDAAPPPGMDRVARWDHAVMRGLLAPDAGAFGFQLEQVPDGVEVQVRNVNAPGSAQVFRSAGGRLAVGLQDTLPGDSISVRMNAPLNFVVEDPQTGKMRSIDFTVDGTYVIPSAEHQQQMRELLDIFQGLPRRDLQAALDLFGPHSRIEGGPPRMEPAKLRAVFSGAQLGSATRESWAAAVRAHVKQHGTPELLEGFDLGRAFVKATGKPLTDGLDLRLTRQDPTRQVITGGYSPISGSHGPLRPEYIRGAQYFELTHPGLPPLELKEQGGSPVGWVNPNAIGMTFGFTLGQPGSATFSYDFPPR